MILLKRTYRERCRDYFDTIRLVQALAIALLLGLLWWKSNYRTEAQLRDQAIGEFFGAAVMSMKRAGMIASLVLMLFLLTGGYYVQVSKYQIKEKLHNLYSSMKFDFRVLKRGILPKLKTN